MQHDGIRTLDAWRAQLASASGLPVVPGTSPPEAALRAARAGRDSIDLQLWRQALVASTASIVKVPLGEGPLVPWDGSVAIEVWTEEELSGLHALWRIGRVASLPPAWDRARAAMRWHLEHTQPDNATNRPWAVHAFLLEGSGEALAYAGTLLHNALAMQGRPDPVSAWILMDAAAELQAQTSLRGPG